MYTYITKGTCSKKITFDVDEDNRLHNVKFVAGCPGNLQAIGRLVEGMDIDQVEQLLRGVKCRNNTSCTDQLSRAITEYKASRAAQGAASPEQTP